MCGYFFALIGGVVCYAGAFGLATFEGIDYGIEPAVDYKRPIVAGIELSDKQKAANSSADMGHVTAGVLGGHQKQVNGNKNKGYPFYFYGANKDQIDHIVGSKGGSGKHNGHYAGRSTEQVVVGLEVGTDMEQAGGEQIQYATCHTTYQKQGQYFSVAEKIIKDIAKNIERYHIEEDMPYCGV